MVLVILPVRFFITWAYNGTLLPFNNAVGTISLEVILRLIKSRHCKCKHKFLMAVFGFLQSYSEIYHGNLNLYLQRKNIWF
ncbi:hypothetical protein CS542_06450 [Pedobacter sp. IW39]|nr:hypothetical protein CS542_06450 [Pedobacter sp. IW39]